jgi:predicted RND superfamily exporter protein
MLSSAFAEAPQADVKLLLPIMYGIFIVMLFIFLRSISLVFVTVVLVGLSAGGALGVAGWMGVQLNGVSVSAPTVILTLAIADSVHILLAMMELMQHEGYAKDEALIESMRMNARAVFLASLTTVVGFLSLNFGDAPPMWDLGNITALGVALAWAYSFVLLPALVAVLPVRGRELALNASLSMDKLADFVIRRRWPLLGTMSVIAVLLAVAVTRFEINDRPVEYFGRNNSFRQATEFMTQNLTGFYGMNISLPSGEPGGINDPKYLSIVSGFIDGLRARADVAHVDSIADTMKRLNKNMHGDDPAYYRLPDDRDLAAQYLLLYEMSLPYGLDLNDQINVDKSATRVSIINTDVDFKHLKEFKEEAQQWLKQNGLPAMRDAEGASPAVMFAHIAERNIRSMIGGSIMAFLLISLTLTVALRSVKLGLISIIPNLIPIAMAFGIWALLWGTVDFAISIVTGVAFGIIDDDSIHWLATYQRARSERGLGTVEAVRYTFSTVGNALWANSLVLVVGFGALAFSQFWPNATMGLLTAITIAVALIADFLMLPPLLMLLDRDGSGRGDPCGRPVLGGAEHSPLPNRHRTPAEPSR